MSRPPADNGINSNVYRYKAGPLLRERSRAAPEGATR